MSPKGADALARDPASVFAALGDRTRLRLVARMAADEPQSISRLTAGTGVTRQAVTRHLQVLAAAGLVRGRRRGREVVWAIEPDRLVEARRALDEISAQWDRALARLRAHVEAE
ncbi:MAG: helix-turn-helix transcriptional regulator [Acidobacteria bacterium]|nr:helix-turn-helix transcriptional regulator [Acidobacteriota bacterium]